MRFKSEKSNGYQVFAVAGVNTISFGIKASVTAKKGLLGFAVERFDPQANERYAMPGFKVFRSVIPLPTQDTRPSTWDHPIQSFVWDDFTAKPGHVYEYLFYPVKGKPKNLDLSAAPLKIRVQTEPLFSSLEHDIFFNRGVASSQAYTCKFGNSKPSALSPKQQKEALQWLSRELDDAILRFIQRTRKGDGLLCCFYEFRYGPVLSALKKAIERDVDVRIIIDAKVNERTDKKGVFHPSFPREDNLKAIKAAGIPKERVILREAGPANIQHNKFMVLLKGKKQLPTEVWTGSTNLSLGGFHGQTNVGHWLRNPIVAQSFHAYWSLLSSDPGARDGDDRATARMKNKAFRSQVEAICDVPSSVDSIIQGVTPVFSPRMGLKVLDLYVKLMDSATMSSAITLAFGINRIFKEQLKDNTQHDHIVFMLLEKEDRPKKNSKDDPFIAINASNNVYKAWGSYLDDPVYQWTRETNARILEFNSHVAYIHSKFLLMDPLGRDPVVVTGSANFSAPSTNANDENMLIIRGDRRVADIFFTEFNRLFNHYYFRAVHERASRRRNTREESLFLAEDDSWTQKYLPGKLKQKRLDLYSRMAL